MVTLDSEQRLIDFETAEERIHQLEEIIRLKDEEIQQEKKKDEVSIHFIFFESIILIIIIIILIDCFSI